MATKGSKPAGRKIADSEVKDSYHDEVLNWLVDDLESLISDNFGMTEEAADAQLSKAKEQFKGFIRNDVSVLLDKWLEEKTVVNYSYRTIQLDKGTLVKLQEGKQHIDPTIEASMGLKISSSAGDAEIQSYEVMKRVAYLERKLERGNFRETIKEIPAGYVDLYAELFVPNSFDIKLAEIPFEGLSDSFQLYDNENCVQLAEALKSKGLTVAKIGEKRNLFFSVRTDPFTLGEVLQELKELRQLEDQSQGVVLVVDNIEPSLRTKIEREGFMVIARCDYTSGILS